MDIAIIGGGASGLCSAICAARNLRKKGLSGKVTVLERSQKIGKSYLLPETVAVIS